MSIKKAFISYKITQVIRALLILIVFGFSFIQVLILNPASVNENHSLEERKMIDRKDILLDLNNSRINLFEGKKQLAHGIPGDQIPQYRLKKLSYISNHAGKKEWRLKAAEARQFHKDKLTYALKAHAELFSNDPAELPTIITGLEARYEAEERKLEVFGNVKIIFPDGFTVHSEYMIYEPQQRTIFIPEKYGVIGQGTSNDSKEIKFISNGMNYPMETGKINLLSQVLTELTPKDSQSHDPNTQIFSDHAVIDRNEKTAYYTMKEVTPEKRFVKLLQPTLDVVSRRMRLNYSNQNKSLEQIFAMDEVTIKEYDEKKVLTRRATCDESQFDYHKNMIYLRGYPQVYQNQDTITGQYIVINRNSDTVRVERSNAYNTGS